MTIVKAKDKCQIEEADTRRKTKEKKERRVRNLKPVSRCFQMFVGEID